MASAKKGKGRNNRFFTLELNINLIRKKKYDSYNTTMYYKCTKLSCAGKGIFKNNIFHVSKQCTAPACLEITRLSLQVVSIDTQTDPICVHGVEVATQSKI
ncbi:unnamed protein product [Gordionus sp. m RMFG-2023]